MARRGVWQLQKLTINYCDFSGSSKGTRYAIYLFLYIFDGMPNYVDFDVIPFRREFLQSWLPRFKDENPHLEILEAMRRGIHPFISAHFSTSRQNN